MSNAHQEEFKRIKLEHALVVAALRSAISEHRRNPKGRNSILSAFPGSDSMQIEAAIGTSNDAYALVLMATAERFMRAYLANQGIVLGDKPQLDVLMRRCCKEFNKTNPRIPIHPDAVREMDDLRKMRNEYAHGQSISVFPTVGRVAAILGRFFDQLP
jgi:hypothetical protein